MDMSAGEETISFLNNYFVYRKTHDVDAKQIATKLMGSTQLEQEEEIDETEEAQQALQEVIAAKKKATKPKKLKRKLRLRKSESEN